MFSLINNLRLQEYYNKYIFNNHYIIIYNSFYLLLLILSLLKQAKISQVIWLSTALTPEQVENSTSTWPFYHSTQWGRQSDPLSASATLTSGMLN